MAKSTSPSRSTGAPRGRSKTKIPELKDAAEGDEKPKKSQARSKSRGRPSKTAKEPAKRKSSTKRAPSKPRARSQSKSRKSDPKPRSRSVSRKSTAAEKAAKEESPAPRSRRSVAAKESLAAKPIVTRSLPTDAKHPDAKPSRVYEYFNKAVVKVRAFGYRRTFAAAWWLVSVPAFVLGLHLLCSRDHCYIRFNPTIPKTLRVYADPLVLAYGAGLITLQCLLSLLPIGRVVHGFGYRRVNYSYRCNSLLCLTLSILLYVFCFVKLHLPNLFILQSHRFKCVSAATVLAFIVSLLLYIKSFVGHSTNINHGSPCSPGVEGNHLHDFVHGRQVSPRIGKTFDIGLVVIRVANCIWAMAALSTLMQARGQGPFYGWNYSVVAVVCMHLLYVFMGSLNEVYLLKSAFVQQGVGFLYVFSSMVMAPFCSTLPLRYLVDGKVLDLPLPCYAPLALLFLVGLWLIHYSNSMKYHNARVGGKTLRSGPWGYIRHPNYLGELLCILAWTIPCGKVVLPYAHFIFVFGIVVCRSILSERHTNSDYRAYQQQVRYRILPPIF